jgi:hypothetical protein
MVAGDVGQPGARTGNRDRLGRAMPGNRLDDSGPQAVGPLALACAGLARVLGRPPNQAEREIVARMLDEYRLGCGREADREWMASTLALLALTRDVADQALAEVRAAAGEAVAMLRRAAAEMSIAAAKSRKEIEAATRERTWHWRRRKLIAAALACLGAAMIAGGMVGLASGGTWSLAWWWQWWQAYWAAFVPLLAGAATVGVAATMAAPELWQRTR